MRIRTARFAGSWYPAEPDSLTRILIDAQTAAKSQVIRDLPHLNQNYLASILPHAGLRYSAALIMAGIMAMKIQPNQPVIILAPSHYLPLDPDHLYTAQFDRLATPLGMLNAWSISKDEGIWEFYPQAIEMEHALEMFLPCLKFIAPSCQVLPIIVPEISSLAQLAELKNALETLINERASDAVIIASSDITHYGLRFGSEELGKNYQTSSTMVRSRDQIALAMLAEPNPQKFFPLIAEKAPSMCGRFPSLLLSSFAQSRSWQGEILGYYNSVEALAVDQKIWPTPISGKGESEYVSYAAVGFHPQGA